MFDISHKIANYCLTIIKRTYFKLNFPTCRVVRRTTFTTKNVVEPLWVEYYWSLTVKNAVSHTTKSSSVLHDRR